MGTDDSAVKENGFRFDRKDAAMLALLTAICVMVLWPIISAGAEVAPGLANHDARTQWYPWRAYAAESIKSGVFPLWNPYILCGVPFVGNFQSALFYPPNLVFLIVPIGVAARASILLHVWLSILFTYLLARQLRCGLTGAAVSAMVFGFCAAQLLRVPAGHWGVSCAIPWLALILLCTELLMRKPSRIVLVVGACAAAFQVLSGVPQYVFISVLAAASFAIVRSIGAGLDWRGRLRRWGAFAGMYALGAGVAAIQLLPGIEAAMNGARSLPMRRAWIEQFSLAPEWFFTLLIPGFFGGTKNAPYWGRFLYWEMIAYIGVVGLVLVLYALFFLRPRRTLVWFAVPALLMLLLAFGKHTPLMGFMLWAFPMSGMFRGAAKFLLPFSLFLAILAGLGADALAAEWKQAGKRFVCLTFLLLAAVGVLLALASPTGGMLAWLQEEIVSSGECLMSPGRLPTPGELAKPLRASGIASLLILACMLLGCLWMRRSKVEHGGRMFQAMLITIVIVDFYGFSRLFIGPECTFKVEGSAWPKGGAELLRLEGGEHRALAVDCPQMNDGMLERVPTVEGIEPNPPAYFHQLFRAGHGLSSDIAPSVYQLQPSPIADAAALGRILVREEMRAEIPDGHIILSDEEWNLWGLNDAVPRALIVREAVWGNSPSAFLQMSLRNDPRETVVLDTSASPPPSDSFGDESSARIVESGPNRVRIAATLKESGWLVLLDNYFPGWKATVDGVPTKIHRANFAFRAVALASGEHEVVFLYKPLSLRLGIGVSAAALLACAVITLSVLRRKYGSAIAD